MTFSALDSLVNEQPYALDRDEKLVKLLAALREVADHHYRNCPPYRRLCDKREFRPAELQDLADLPYLPTSVFKDVLLLSTAEADIFREVKSSATTTGRPSRIGLDKATSRRQSKCFNKVTLDRIGNERFKFIILDTPATVARSEVVSARSSTIRSLLFCASETVTCCVEEGGGLRIDEEVLHAALEEAQANRTPVVIFGFTFILYAYVVRHLLRTGRQYSLPGSKVIHIGGWKKLEAEKVSPDILIRDCSTVFGVSPRDVVDLYGFTEQAGLLYPTCEEGLRHVPAWGEVLVRDPLTLKPLPPGETGVLQFITPIETSYPGHSVLTEDIGRIVDTAACLCGRKGTAFEMLGRAEKAEVRGCGDIMAEQFA